ncbi:uncharacterized protein LOC119733845 [Patiria miniata]|uniref:Uncharacterized protein n=1 Tax=Patiria miniata TaxID=46514 RepID=A0A914AHX5_PATMI|nr:uncharacterized protein LOC119733845 [Patiria miniata]
MSEDTPVKTAVDPTTQHDRESPDDISETSEDTPVKTAVDPTTQHDRESPDDMSETSEDTPVKTSREEIEFVPSSPVASESSGSITFPMHNHWRKSLVGSKEGVRLPVDGEVNDSEWDSDDDYDPSSATSDDDSDSEVSIPEENQYNTTEDKNASDLSEEDEILRDINVPRNIDNETKESTTPHNTRVTVQEANDDMASQKQMWEYLRPAHVDKIVEAALDTAVQEHLQKKLTDEDLYQGDVTWSSYQQVAQYAQARLLTFNKRRSGELEAIHLKSYLQRTSVADVDSGLTGQLSETEQYLLQNHDLLETRGRVGHRVPVVIPKDCQRALAYLANSEMRKKAGVRQTNKYLFPNAGDSVLRAYDSLKKVCQECDLQIPGRNTSVNLRKYMATLAQVMDLTPNQMDWVCKHLGHSKTVHLNHNRVMSSFLERVEIGKLLLMQDLNVQSNFVGKTLIDVDFSSIVFRRA